MPLTDFCTSARQSPVAVWVVRLAMGKFLRSHAACEANHATRKCSFKAVWTKRSWFIGASADYAHKNGRNHFAQIYFFQFLGTIFCVIFQNPPTFEATSRRSFEGRTHPHQRKETVLSHKYNAFCLVSLNFEHFLSLLDLNLSRYRSGIWSFYFLLLKNYTAAVKNTSTMYTYKC